MITNTIDKLDAYCMSKWEGKCISTDVNKSNNYKYECKKKHIFTKSISDIRSGKFCDICSIKNNIDNNSDVIDAGIKLFEASISLILSLFGKKLSNK